MKMTVLLRELNPTEVLELAGKKQLLCYDSKSGFFAIVNSKEEIVFVPGIFYFSLKEVE